MLPRFTPLAAMLLFAFAATAPAQIPATSPAATLPAGVRLHRGLVYAHTPDAKPLKIDLYLPAEPPGPAPQNLPTILRLSTRRETPSAAALNLLADGYALAYAGYLPDDAPDAQAFSPFPNDVFAAKAAIRFLRGTASQYHLDSDRIGLWGDGHGATIAALVAMTPDQKSLAGTLGDYPNESTAVRALCLLGGTTDWRNAELYGDETVNFPG